MSEHTYNRVDLAVEQLGVALRLFLDDRSFGSALTLAGAAEEVLGRAVEHNGGQSTLQRKYVAMAEVDKALFGRPLKFSDFAAEENAARNALKHMRSATDTSLTADLEDAACWMLVRACHNYELLNLEETDDMRRFRDWFYANVVGF